MKEEECGEVYSPELECKDGSMYMVGMCIFGVVMAAAGFAIGWLIWR